MAESSIVVSMIATGMVVCIASFLYRYNAFFKFAEHTFVGLASGYLLVTAYQSTISSTIVPISEGEIMRIIPLILGILIFTTLAPRQYSWPSYIPIGILVGIGIGLTIRSIIFTDIISQLKASFVPITFNIQGINNLLMSVIVLGIIIYFVYSSRMSEVVRTGMLLKLATFGRFAMMVTFGVSFGQVLLAHISLTLSAVEKMVIMPGVYVTAIAVILIVFDIYKRSRGVK